MQKWLSATLVSATALGGLATAVSPAASAATGEASKRSDILAATAAADAAIPHKAFYEKDNAASNGSSEVRAASVLADPKPAATATPQDDIVTCWSRGYPPKIATSTDKRLYSYGYFGCEPHNTDSLTETVMLQVWNGTLKKWFTVETSTNHTPHSGEHLMGASIDRPCRPTDPLHTWRTYVAISATLGTGHDGDSGFAPSQGDPRQYPHGRGVQLHCAPPATS